MLVRELERAGIPTAHVCSITSVARMVGSSRIIPVHSIVHPTGNPDLGQSAEKAFRRTIAEKALESLTTEVREKSVFVLPL